MYPLYVFGLVILAVMTVLAFPALKDEFRSKK